LERAEKVEAVTQLIETGKQYEEDGNVSFAHADYQEAFRLDPESEEARKGLDRVKSQIKNEEFQQLISEGLAAFHNNEFQLARKKLLKAKSFKPESREVKDALAEVDQGIRLARITELRKKAMKAESMENWKEGLASYLAALEIDKNVQFAVQGKERVLKQIQIDKRVNFFLQDPAVLNSDQQLEHALSLVHDIERMEPKGPRRTAELKELRRLVTAAQTPVKLIIESDNVTEVAIYKVGKLGRFNVRELALRPGTYTVVGARDGYKDVRQRVVIKTGQNELRISVKCEARI
jgi:tetratricopeptide (TPR) repeat protein